MSKSNARAGELVDGPAAEVEAYLRDALDAPADEKNYYVRHAIQLLPLLEASTPRLDD
jgi:hypothetical protein